jgi:hypothetical protein
VTVRGVLSCFDRVVIQGTLPTVCHAGIDGDDADSRNTRMFDYCTEFAKPFRESIRAHAERAAGEQGVEVEYIKKPKGFRKEDAIGEIVATRGSHPGLVHIFSVMELCSSDRTWARQEDRHDASAARRWQGRSLLLLLHRRSARAALSEPARLASVSRAVLLQWA